MDNAYNLTKTGNSEIRFCWHKLCLRANYLSIVPHVLDFVTSMVSTISFHCITLNFNFNFNLDIDAWPRSEHQLTWLSLCIENVQTYGPDFVSFQSLMRVPSSRRTS